MRAVCLPGTRCVDTPAAGQDISRYQELDEFADVSHLGFTDLCSSLNHLVRPRQQRQRDRKAEGLRASR